MAEWISLSNEKPKDEEIIIFLEPYIESILGECYIGYFLDGRFYNKEDDLIDVQITHWFYVPDTAKVIDIMNEFVDT